MSEILVLDRYFFNPYAIPMLFTSIVTVLLGFFVLIRERGSLLSALFFLVTLAAGIWFLSDQREDTWIGERIWS